MGEIWEKRESDRRTEKQRLQTHARRQCTGNAKSGYYPRMYLYRCGIPYRRARSNPEESIKENRRCIYGREITKSRKATEWQSGSLYISLSYCHSTPNALYYQQSKKEQTKQITRREILAMKITDDIIYVGVNDHDIDLFEAWHTTHT